jgi:hypothetical protein
MRAQDEPALIQASTTPPMVLVVRLSATEITKRHTGSRYTIFSLNNSPKQQRMWVFLVKKAKG